jgi:raffinose/stachyose/melibiose transport system substrate-binding protein
VRRRFGVGLAIVTVALVALGASASYGAKKQPITLTAWSYDNQSPGLEPVLKQLTAQFEKSHPGVKINLVFKSFNDLVGTVARALASGSGPDVTEGNEGYQTDSQLVKAKLIIPLTKYVNKYHWNSLLAPSEWGMMRWTPDGKSFGKGPIWGIAQTGQNVIAFYNKKTLRSLGFDPNKMPTTFSGFENLLSQIRAKLPTGQPVIEEGNKEGYGWIHLFGGIWGAYTRPAAIRNWVYHVPGSSYDTASTIKALTTLQQWQKDGYFNDDFNAVGNDASASLFAKGKGVFWIGGNWDATVIKAGLGQNAGAMAVPPGGTRVWTGIGSLSGPWHISAKSKYPDIAAAWLNYIFASPTAQKLMFSQAQLPAAANAKAPNGDPYLNAVYTGWKKVAADNGLLLYTDWASPTMYTTLQNQFELLLAGRATPAAMAKAVQDDWLKFDKTLH